MKTWNDFQAAFENTHARDTTKTRYSYALESLRGYFHDRHPNDIFRVDVLNFKDWRLKQVSPSTVRFELTIGSSFWSWMLDREYVDHNPFLNVKRPSPANPKHRWLTQDQIDLLWQKCPDNLRIAMAIWRQTPLDSHSVAKLTKEAFDFENKLLRLVRGKTQKDWVIPVRDDLLEFISTLPEGPLYPECYNHRTPGKKLSQRFGNYSRRVLGRNVGAHAFRHTYATEALRHDVDIRTVMALMAHSSINTTAIYLTPGDNTSARKFLEQIK